MRKEADEEEESSNEWMKESKKEECVRVRRKRRVRETH